MPDFLLEIGTEEIPAGFLPEGRRSLEKIAREKLAAFSGLLPADARVEVFGAPRRLALLVLGMASQSEASEQLHKGPPSKIAFAADGSPTKAALGFAAKLGLKTEALENRDGYLVGRTVTAGRPADQILAEVIPQVLASLPWPKSMRWNASGIRFVRPVRWIVAMLDDRVLTVEWAGVQAGAQSFIRRVPPAAGGARLAIPAPIPIAAAAGYLDTLRAAGVRADQSERAKIIGDEVVRRAAKLGATPVLMDGDSTCLYLADHVEDPIVITGEFDANLTEAPVEALELTMWKNQKYIPLLKNDALLPNFLIVANRMFGRGAAEPDRFEANVVAGNRRVLSARLADARYFWKTDLDRPLMDRLDDLSRVTFQKDVGSIRDRVARIESIAQRIASALGVTDHGAVTRAARLAKADLTTKMVFEFPELQGVIGKRLALAQGENPAIAAAIEQHYWPAGPDSPVPAGLSAVIALAEKADTLVSIFSAGLEPTGSADPYGLRRAAIGIIRILLDHGEGFDVRSLIAEPKVLAFIRGRLIHFMIERVGTADAAVNTSIAEAVAAAGWENIPDYARRLAAAATLPTRDDFADLKTSFKRVVNILSDGQDPALPEADLIRVDESRFSSPSEQKLYAALQKMETDVAAAQAARKIESALAAMAAIRPDVDRFYDDVLVNDPDPELRRNRRAVLRRAGRVFLGLMDFSRL